MSNPVLDASRSYHGSDFANPVLRASQSYAKSGSKKKSGGGLAGALHKVSRYSGAELAGNLVEDVGQAAVGLPVQIVATGGALKKAFVESHGDPYQTLGRFLIGQGEQYGKQSVDYYRNPSNVYEHPLQATLDALTLASLGTAGGVRLAAMAAPESRAASLAERDVLETRSPRAIVTGEGPVATELTSTSPFVQVRERAAAAGRRAKPTGGEKGRRSPVGAEAKRFGKLTSQEAQVRALTQQQPFHFYERAVKRLSADDWTALNLRSFGVHPDDLATVWKGTPDAALLTPKVRDLMLNPSKKILRAEPVAERFAGENAALLRDEGLLSPESEAARPNLVRSQVGEQLGRDARPIPGGPEPYYVPHVAKPQPVKGFQAVGGGKAPPRVPGTTKLNQGVLFRLGGLHLASDLAGPEFLRRVRFSSYRFIHGKLVDAAVPVTADELRARGGLPEGWTYVREKPSTTVPYSIRNEGPSATADELRSLVPDPTDLHRSPLSEGFTTPDAEQALGHEKGVYRIIPESTAKAATGEFTRSSEFVYKWVRRPLAVWRAIVLGLRVGFLTNNVIGNSVLYAVKTGGRGAIRDLFMSLVESHPGMRDRILRNTATPKWLRDEQNFYKRNFPEQNRGTLGLTQSPSTGIVSEGLAAQAPRAGRAVVGAGRAITGVLPRAVSATAEVPLRNALIRNYIRHSPEFRKVWKNLPRHERRFTEAAQKIIDGEGGKEFQARISKQVNQSLGDYLHLSPKERTVLRNAAPFYSWYKAIVTITYHLAVDTPLRANILGRIGQIGFQQNQQAIGDVPSFLAGAIGLGSGPQGTERVFATQGANPFATLEQLRRGLTTDVTDAGLNPFLMAALQSYAKGSEGGRISFGGLLQGAALGAGYGIASGLPPVRLAFPPPPSRLYPTRSRRTEVLSQLGLPVKEFNPAEARRQKAEGR